MQGVALRRSERQVLMSSDRKSCPGHTEGPRIRRRVEFAKSAYMYFADSANSIRRQITTWRASVWPGYDFRSVDNWRSRGQNCRFTVLKRALCFLSLFSYQYGLGRLPCPGPPRPINGLPRRDLTPRCFRNQPLSFLPQLSSISLPDWLMLTPSIHVYLL